MLFYAFKIALAIASLCVTLWAGFKSFGLLLGTVVVKACGVTTYL